jgi:hypothetical protein
LSQTDFDEEGKAALQVMPGKYSVITNYTEANNENATDFNTFSTTFEVFVSMFESDNEDIEIVLSDERLFSGTITAGSENFTNSQFLLFNESNNQFLSANTNDTGSFAKYIPSGDWIVIISPVDIDNVTYTLRSPISITDDSSSRTELQLVLSEAALLNFSLIEDGTNEPVVNARVVAISQDGLGNVTLSSSDENGHVSDKIMPGSWILSLEKEISDEKWELVDSNYQITTQSGESLELGNVSVDLEVLIGGKFYWDSNENGNGDLTEIISSANVTITSVDESLEFFTETDEFGVWK